MLKSSRTVDQIGVQERVARLRARSIKNESKVQALNLALSMIDLTTLEGRDSPGKVFQLCYKATHLHERFPGLPHVAAVCVYAPMIKVAKMALRGSGVKVAAVATAFPSGMSSLDTKLAEVTRAVQDGADEVDMVISRGRFLSGDRHYVFDEIAHVKQACGQVHLKVILETGAGVRATLPNELYEKAGALIGKDANETYSGADIVLKVRPPIANDQGTDELGMIKPGTLLVGLLDPLQNKGSAQAYASAGITAFAMELLPRISRAQSLSLIHI